jgi:hypothetical protein
MEQSTEVAYRNPYLDFLFGDEVYEHEGTSKCGSCGREYSSSPTVLGYNKCNAVHKIVKTQKVKEANNSTSQERVWEDDTAGWNNTRTFTSSSRSRSSFEQKIFDAQEGDVVSDWEYRGYEYYRIEDSRYQICGGGLNWSLEYTKKNQEHRLHALVNLSGGYGFDTSMNILLEPLNWWKVPDELKRDMVLNLGRTVVSMQWSIDSLQGAIKNLDSRMNNAGYQMMR